VIALDTNLLVFAHREGTAYHEPAVTLLRDLSTGRAPYAIFWPSLYEFLRVVTHHRVFNPPSSPEEALDALASFLEPPVVRVLSETPAHADVLRQVMARTRTSGNLLHDAHLVALAVEHGVHEILTLDEDFRRFPQVAARNPFA
jgi:toxin-antitoxin system PIN domain toxin